MLEYQIFFSYLFYPVVEGHSMDYNDVSSAFSKLVETHFLQRCPPLAGPQKTDSTTTASPAAPGAPADPASTTPLLPESNPDCYKVPHVTLIGRGKRPLASEEGDDQRNSKKAKLDPEVSVLTHKKFITFSLILNCVILSVLCLNFSRFTAMRGFIGR